MQINIPSPTEAVSKVKYVVGNLFLLDVKNPDEVKYLPAQKYIDQIRAEMKPAIDLTIGGVTLPYNRELQGFYISGSTGSGKTVLQKSICRQVAAQNHKMCIYDPKPEFVREFWKDGHVIFNPLDERGVAWSMWAEVRMSYDRKAIAESFIGMDVKLTGIYLKAQMIFAGMIEATSCVSELQAAMRMPAKTLANLLIGTDAENAVDDTPGTGIALSIMKNKMEIFNYLRDPMPGEVVFSLRDWVSNDADRRWVFLTAREDQRKLLGPLLTAVVDIIGNSVMSLTPNDELPKDEQRRIWLMLEELPSLPRIPVLEGLTAKGRGFGMCWILTTQDPAQIDVVYTPEIARSIRQNCNTWIVFRANDFDTATMISNQIGVYEEDEKNKTYSMGVDDSKDGKGFINRRVDRQAVFASEVQRLPDLTAYLLFYGPYPSALVTIPFEPFKSVIEGIVEREDLKVNRKKVIETIDHETGEITTSYEDEDVLEGFADDEPADETVSDDSWDWSQTTRIEPTMSGATPSMGDLFNRKK